MRISHLQLPGKEAGYTEFILMMAALVSINAMSIDMILPALGLISNDFQLAHANDNQYVIGVLLLGFSTGQFLYGPLSDSIGRKPAIYLGTTIAVIGTLLCLFATSYTMLLIGRCLQGLGVAAQRSIVVAIIRDKYSGAAMARVLSLVMTIFIIVPVIAPAIGQLILFIASWHAIFAVFLIVLIVNFIWFAVRQPETLRTQYKTTIQRKTIVNAAIEVCTNRFSFGYTIISGLLFGAFFGYLNSIRQIFQEMFSLGNWFAFVFAGLALSFGIASLTNARLVTRFSIKRITLHAIRISLLAAICFLLFYLSVDNTLYLLSGFLLFCIISFFCLAISYTNLNTLAMEPMQHIAGMASAITGGISSIVSICFGIIIGQLYNDTLIPLMTGFIIAGMMSLGVFALIQSPPSAKAIP